MAYDVKVNIKESAPIGKASFGYPLILSVGKASAYTVCKTLEEVVAAGFANTTDTYKAAALMFSQENVPEKIAVMGVTNTENIATDLADKDFRQVMVVDGEESDVTTIATYINTTKDKLLFTTSNFESGGEGIVGTPPTGERVVWFIHSNPLAVAAFIGESAGRAVGSFNYKCLILNGIEPMNYTDSDLEIIHSNGALTFVTKAGDNVTTDGCTTNGDFIDIIDIKDYVVRQVVYRTQRLLNVADKITYDDLGIARLENVARTVMVECYGMGIIATVDGAPAYTVNYKKRAETTADERATRKYNGGKFSFTAAGAINDVEVNATIEF